MAGTQDIINETQDNAMSGVVPSGEPIGSEKEREAVRRAISAKGAWSGMDVARSALMGAGLGSQTQATNPMTAFLQGVTAGLGAPAEVYRAKQDQIKSAVGASPFGAIVEEANNPDNPLYAFRGLPYELVSKAVVSISQKAIEIKAEADTKEKESKGKYIQAGQDAINAAKLLQEADPEHKPRTPESLVGFLREDLDSLIKTKSDGKGAQTIGSAAADRAFAREYAEYLGAGGYSDTQNQIKSLEDARNQLSSGGQYTGWLTNMISGNLVNPKAKALQQQIESSVQRTLKQTLGGQFTEREGQLFMQRGFDPKLSERENIKKLTRMIDQLKIMDIAKREAIDYFERNGTLEGYRGKYYTINNGVISVAALKGTGTGLTPEEEQEMAELEKKLGGK